MQPQNVDQKQYQVVRRIPCAAATWTNEQWVQQIKSVSPDGPCECTYKLDGEQFRLGTADDWQTFLEYNEAEVTNDINVRLTSSFDDMGNITQCGMMTCANNVLILDIDYGVWICTAMTS